MKNITFMAFCLAFLFTFANAKNVTTLELQKAVENGAILVDTRANDVFIGWAVDGNLRGGHIPGATDFSARWLISEYDEKNNLEKLSREQVLKEALENKQILSKKQVILYDTNGKDAKLVGEYLAKMGVSDVLYYDANEWVKDSKKPLISYEGYKRLLPPSIVSQACKGEYKAFSGKNVVVVDVGWGDEKASGYNKGHIPCAVHINTDSFEPPRAYVDGIEEWRLDSDEALVRLLLANGITKDSIVISTGAEPMASARFAMICEYLGVENVYLLNGGLVSYKASGYELSKISNLPKAAKEFGGVFPKYPKMIIKMDEVSELLKDKNKQLIDNRTWQEYIGETSGYSYHKKKGRIDGAFYGYAGLKSSSSMYFYRNIDKTMRNPEEILKMWQKSGIDTNKDMTFMCGSGWRAAEILWYSKVMGMKNTNIYSDGWIAWSNEGRPFVVKK